MPSSRSKTRVGILGGSSAFLPSLATALADRAADLPPLELRLLGRDAGRSAGVARFCNGYAAQRGVPHRYLAVSTVDAAARDAAIVINQVRVGGFAGRSADARLALEFGYPGDETIGPAGLAAAVRSLPTVLALCRKVAEVAPDCWLLQMSNPMSILLDGLLRRTTLRTFGLCELPEDTLQRALALLDLRPSDVESTYLGTNHQGWFIRVERDGRDLLPAVFDRIEGLGPESFFRVDAAAMRSRHALPLHYLRLYLHRDREVKQMRGRFRDRGEELGELSESLHDFYRTTESFALPAPLANRSMPWNAMSLVPVVGALLGGASTEAYVSDRNAGYLPGIPAGALVEKRAQVTAAGPEALADPALSSAPETHPELCEFLTRVCAFEAAATDAALSSDPQRAAEALRLHPFEISADAATAMGDTMFRGPNR